MKSHNSLFMKMALAAVLFLGAPSFMQVHSQGLMASNSAVSKIQFVGMEGEMLVFDLQLSNLPAKGSWIRVTDDEKNILFEQRINSTIYAKRYKIIRENIKGLHFEVISKETILKESFQLRYKVEEKMEVVKA
jgi:hypothetical protein